ncbi:MAG: hypothetical protein NT141_03740 [candidate division WWE3 bacterium]|nr:hypothetical protein [candidate division WWE3 bacterium]
MGGQARHPVIAQRSSGFVHSSAQAFTTAWNYVQDKHPWVPTGMLHQGVPSKDLNAKALKAWNSLPKDQQCGQGLAKKLKGNYHIS